MKRTIEERVEILEKELTDLKHLIQNGHVKKNWQSTFGMSADDPDFEEMIRLGSEVRERDREGLS